MTAVGDFRKDFLRYGEKERGIKLCFKDSRLSDWLNGDVVIDLNLKNTGGGGDLEM